MTTALSRRWTCSTPGNGCTMSLNDARMLGGSGGWKVCRLSQSCPNLVLQAWRKMHRVTIQAYRALLTSLPLLCCIHICLMLEY